MFSPTLRIAKRLQKLIRARQQTRFFGRKKIAERLFRNPDVRSDMDEAVKLDHITRAHANAAVTGTPPDAPFFGGAVDVDTARPRVGRSAVHAAQPDHA